VHELAKRLTAKFQVVALVPHAPGAEAREMLDGVEIIRYRYAPARFETLVNDGGIVTNLRGHPWKLLLVPGFVLAQAWCAWRVLRARRVAVIHAHWLLPQGLIAATLRWLSRRCPPYLVTSHGADLFALRGWWLNALKRFVIRRAGAVTVVSHAMRGELARIQGDVSKVVVRPMGVDLVDRFTPDPAVERSTHEVLFVGRLVEKKGLRYLIDAIPAVLAAVPRARLRIAGYGPDEAELRLQVKRLRLDANVQFLGPVSQQELPALYRRASVFVAPFVQAASGDQEGLGLVCVEALGCGCPVVVSDLPATRDVFPRGAGCVRVVPGNRVALADAIVDILLRGEVHRRNIESCRARVVQQFDWWPVSARYAEILHECIDHHG
jgi:glycosyltransferase involved in cell wall biosynthesis